MFNIYCIMYLMVINYFYSYVSLKYEIFLNSYLDKKFNEHNIRCIRVSRMVLSSVECPARCTESVCVCTCVQVGLLLLPL